MSFDGGGEEGEGVAALLAAGFDHRQHRLDEAAAGGALRPERELPPNHRMTQRPLARVVRRLDPFVTQKRPQPLAMFVQFPARAAHVGVAALRCRAAANAPPCGGPDPSDAATPPAKSCRPDNRPNARTTRTWPPQAFSQPFRPRVAAVDHRLKIAFQMRPAPLQPSHLPVHLRPIAGDDAVELLASRRRPAPSPRAWHAPRTP